MKKLYVFLLTVLAANAFGQDTTAWRMVGITSSAEVHFFNDDTTDLYTFSSDASTGHAIFVNPADSLLYTVLDEIGGVERNLYLINPFTGDYSLVHDFTGTHINSADLGENGKIYAIHGNGGLNPSEIVVLDLNTMTESYLITSSLTDSRALEYNPVDSTLYIYEGYNDLLYLINLSDTTESSVATTGMNDELHGAYFVPEDSTMFITAYGGEIYTTDNNWIDGIYFGDASSSIMDLTGFPTLRAAAPAFGICPDDSTLISVLYDVPSVKWFMDGVEISGATNDSIYASAAGVYQALIEIDGSGNFVWSESIVVANYMEPVVNVTSAGDDHLICAPEVIVLNGATGGTLQWFLNGDPIVGATFSGYSATAPGVYNQMKTNLDGCSDTSDVSYIITIDPACGVSVAENEIQTIEMYPSPVTDNLTIKTAGNMNQIMIYNITGQIIWSKEGLNTQQFQVDFSTFEDGIYFVAVHVDGAITTQKIVK